MIAGFAVQLLVVVIAALAVHQLLVVLGSWTWQVIVVFSVHQLLGPWTAGPSVCPLLVVLHFGTQQVIAGVALLQLLVVLDALFEFAVHLGFASGRNLWNSENCSWQSAGHQ